MAINFDQANSWTRQLIEAELKSSFGKTKPLLTFLAGQTVADFGSRLGDPSMGTVLGGKAVGKATLRSQLGSYQHQVRYQSSEPDAASAVQLDDATPVASVFADDLVKQFATRWTEFDSPLRVREDRVEQAQGELQVRALLEEALDMGFNKHLKKHQSSLWTGTLTEAQQSAETWQDYIGVQHVATGTGGDFYGGVDRDVDTVLQGTTNTHTVLTAANVITDNVPNLRLIREIITNNTYGGIGNKMAGAGKLVITTPALWNTLANEAEGKHRINHSTEGIPGMLTDTSTAFPIIHKDTSSIVYDEDCPAECCYVLTPEVMVFEIMPGKNFSIDQWQAKWRNDEGGAKYWYTLIRAKTRFTCYRPDLQVQCTGLVTG